MATVNLTFHQQIALITLNRPEKKNALNGETIVALGQIFSDLAENEAVKIVGLRGAGEHFCAGADIAHMQILAQSSLLINEEAAQSLAQLFYQIYTFPKPTIALAHGFTLGGGLGLLAACDIALADEHASFCFSEVKMGLAPSTISPYIVAAIGERYARYYFLTGEPFDAKRAYELGLIQQIIAENAFLPFAENLLKYSAEALRASKELLHLVANTPINPDLVKQTALHLAAIRKQPFALEGLNAFLEKRSPTWK